MNDPVPQRVAILYSDAQRQYFASQQHYLSEAEVEERAHYIQKRLEKMGVTVALCPGNDQLSAFLKDFQPDLVFNLVDSVYGQEYLNASVPGLLELAQLNYIGTGMLGRAINSNKFLTKNLLTQYGITTPKYQLMSTISEPIDPVLDFPLIVKLNEVHGSVEIDDASLCFDEKQLRARVRYLISTYRQPVLVEEFIVGREITVIVLEGLNTKVYCAEKVFVKPGEQKYSIVTFADNLNEETETIRYSKYVIPERVKLAAKRAFEILKMEDFAKFDIRLDESGRHYFIDCNCDPALGPKGMTAIGSILDMYDISFDELLLRLFRNAFSSEHKIETEAHAD